MSFRVCNDFSKGSSAEGGVFWSSEVTILHMWPNTVLYDLVSEKIVKETIRTHNNDVVVLDLVLIVNSIVWQFTVLSALVWEIKLIGLSR